MAFTSLHFLLFVIPVILLYWMIPGKWPFWRAILLLGASYLFYGLWSWKFLYVLGGISLFTFLTGLATGCLKKRVHRKSALLLGIAGTIGTLFIYKYFDFFIPAFHALLSPFQLSFSIQAVRLIVPIGISFYIFLSVSYLVDIYRRKMEPEKNPFYFLLSTSFFPIILAGPINRPSNLIPQLRAAKRFDPELAADGLRQFLWGLVVKMVIADNCATYVDKVFRDNTLTGVELFFGAVLFAIQIYADFSAYSDMAIGVAKLLGVRLVRNFRFPYFARDISDFWQRWHMSLTSWFRDYLFLPLAWFISARIRSQRVLYIPSELVIYSVGILITWTLTGLWHGASTTFLIWGFIHALMLILHQIVRKPKKAFLSRFKLHNNLIYFGVQRIFTLSFVLIAWVFFRSKTLPEALNYLERTFSGTFLTFPPNFPVLLLFPIGGFFVTEWFQRTKEHGLDLADVVNSRVLRWTIYMLLLSLIFFYEVKQQSFIYFKF